MKAKTTEVAADFAATMDSLNDEGIKKLGYCLIDALSGSPEQLTLRLFLSGLPRRHKLLILAEHHRRMEKGL